MKFTNFMKGLMALACITCISSCQDEEFGYSLEDVTNGRYNRVFKDIFGEMDPLHDWSMAASVQANILVGGNTQVVVYSENPLVADNTFLGVVGGKSSTINVQKGLSQVYAEITSEGKVVATGYYDVIDGVINFSESPVSKAPTRTLTRAAGSATCSLYSRTSSTGESAGIVCFDRNTNYKGEKGVVPFPIVWRDGTSDSNKMSYSEGFDYDLYRPESFENMGVSALHNFYIVNGPDFSQKVTRKLVDMYDLFYEYETAAGVKKEAVFHENTNHVKPYLGKSGSGVLSKDAYFVTKGGEPVTMTLVGKGTNKTNDVGYFYYPLSRQSEYLRSDGTLDFDKVNKFVLITDASNSHSLLNGANPYGITQKMEYTDYNQFQQAVQKAGTNADNWGAAIEWKDAEYECTVITLPYFGDGVSPSSETGDFPANYVVGFFSVNPTVGTGVLDHLTCSFANVELNYFNDYPRGAAFSYLGKVYLGIEDDFDYDINDYVFEIGGVLGAPDITPEDHKKKEETVETSWMFACEDLGGFSENDYDFNDVVWEFVQKFKQTTIDGNKTTEFEGAYVRLLAAGGTLPVKLLYKNSALTKDGKSEIHQLFGQQANEVYEPVNITAPKATVPPVEFKLEDITSEVNNLETVKGYFTLEVTGNGNSRRYVTAPDKPSETNKNYAPQVIVLPSNWEWPIENKCIKDAYPNFTNWVEDATDSDWANYKTSNNWYVARYGSRSPERSQDSGSGSSGSGAGAGGNTGGGSGSGSQTPVKGVSSLSISESSVSFTEGGSTSVTYNTNSSGEITVTSSNNNVNVAISGNTISLSATSGVGAQTSTITVSQAEDHNYLENTKTFTVNVTSLTTIPTITLNGVTLTSADITLSGNANGKTNYEYTIDKKYFQDAYKVTVKLTSRSSTKLNADVLRDWYNGGAKSSAVHTIQVNSSDIASIKSNGLKIIDWAIPYSDGCDQIASIEIQVLPKMVEMNFENATTWGSNGSITYNESGDYWDVSLARFGAIAWQFSDKNIKISEVDDIIITFDDSVNGNTHAKCFVETNKDKTPDTVAFHAVSKHVVKWSDNLLDNTGKLWNQNGILQQVAMIVNKEDVYKIKSVVVVLK